MSARLTAVVLNYNGRHLLEVALPSFAAQSYREFDLVVVDNGSTDDSLAWLGEHWPAVEVVALPQNVGVTPALNVCLRARRGELVGLFNNDIELDPGCLAAMVGALDAHPEAGSVCAKLIDFHARDHIDGAGDAYQWSGVPGRRGHGERDRGQYEDERAIFGACGGAAIYRRSVVEDVGEFDEQLAAIYEDADWAFRAQLYGHGCRYVPTAIVYHMGGATLGGELTDFTLYQCWRNAVWLVAKNYPPAALARYGPRVALQQAFNLAWAIRHRRVRVWLRAWRDALRGLPQALRKRRVVQRRRRVGMRELRGVVGG